VLGGKRIWTNRVKSGSRFLVIELALQKALEFVVDRRPSLL
jgi:hypothetical protein